MDNGLLETLHDDDEFENITPDPRILVAITNNPMKPIDALCELIDNSIDGFMSAGKQGLTISNPTIQISIPRANDIKNGQGQLIVLDNGPGMSLKQLVSAVRAGFSTNNPFDQLGLFGLGFNISTGKIGKRTVIISGKREDERNAEIIIDLEEVVRRNSYHVPRQLVDKSIAGQGGTIIKIDRWWEEGSQNHGFISKLIKLGIPTICDELGRRYSTYIRQKNVRIVVNDAECKPFEHCVWSDHRTVRHNRWGLINAVYRFDEVLGIEHRCLTCYQIVDGNTCLKCGEKARIKTIEHRVNGWVGIQRFADDTEYGIDLIRNGRVIRKGERDAFFTWTDGLGNTVMDYPIDGSAQGRIVGEVNLNHVPTDFLKQDFQRTSPEWEEAIRYLRGNTSLQPERARDSEEGENHSYIFKLYQGFRRIRDIGTKDMYMGYWEPGAERPKRISREVIKEFYQKFKDRISGYYDDEEWWKLVEAADNKPPEDVILCPECDTQCLANAEICPTCDYVLKGKNCINQDCQKKIAISAGICKHCGKSQIPQQREMWQCSFCARRNSPETNVCRGCQRGRGEQNTFELTYLQTNSDRNDSLSIENFAISLPGGVNMATTRVNVYTLRSGVNLERDGSSTPVVCYVGEAVDIFIDVRHPSFTKYQTRIHDIIALELAKWIQDRNNRFMTGENRHLWSLSSLYWEIIRSQWSDELAIDPDETHRRIELFLTRIKESLPDLLNNESEDIMNNMSQEEKRELALSLVSNGFDPGHISEAFQEGQFLGYLPTRMIVRVFSDYPERFLDSKFWSDSYSNIDATHFNESTVMELRNLVKARYRNLLEDIISYLETRSPDEGYTKRVNQTLDLLLKKLV